NGRRNADPLGGKVQRPAAAQQPGDAAAVAVQLFGGVQAVAGSGKVKDHDQILPDRIEIWVLRHGRIFVSYTPGAATGQEKSFGGRRRFAKAPPACPALRRVFYTCRFL